MIWGFVDYKNIGSLKGIEFRKYQKLYIFCGPKNPNIKLGEGITASYVLVIVSAPFIFPGVAILLMAALYLGVLEIIGHFAAIKIYRKKK